MKNDYIVREETNIPHKIKRKTANCIGPILLRICRLEHVIVGKIEGRVEVAGRRE
jgi:hypothetical protein